MRPVVVVGAGALGTLLAAVHGRHRRVQLVGRARTVEAVRARGGVTVEGIAAGTVEVEVVRRAAPPPGALVLVTVKAYDLEAALQDIAPRLDRTHTIVVLQNGLGIRTAAERVLRRPVIRAVTFLAAAALEPGRVAFNAVGKTYFPSDAGEVVRTWGSSDLPAVRVQDLATYVWRKLAINAVINPLSALLGVENGALLGLRGTTQDVVDEVVQVARCEGQSLETRRTVAKVRASMRQTARNPSSMLQDMLAGRRTEIDWINGALVRLGSRHGVPTPCNRVLVEMVHARERRSRRSGSRSRSRSKLLASRS